VTVPSAPSDDPRLQVADGPAIAAAADRLQDGELVAFPTETVYGLGADATSDIAVASIYQAKSRPQFNPLIVHVADLASARRYVVFNDRAEQLAAAFWPGSLTLVLPRTTDCPLSLLVSAGLDSVAVRVPDHPVAHDLLTAVRLPIAAPSANRSGKISPTRAHHVVLSWPIPGESGPAVILDGGACPVGMESTVVDLTTDQVTVLRPGGVTEESLRRIVGDIRRVDGTPDQPRSPGMLARHYAPATPVYLNARTALPHGALLGFGDPDGAATLNLSPTGDLTEAAANLFAMLHSLDDGRYRSISVGPVPDHGLGCAINDRLRRAATRQE